VLQLYDPDRSQGVRKAGRPNSYSTFVSEMAGALEQHQGTMGASVRLLTGAVTSPSLAAQISAFQEAFPLAVWHQYEPVNRDQAREGAELAFGEAVDLLYRVDRADVVLSLDADFLVGGAAFVRYAQEFAARRDPTAEGPGMNRLYAVESCPTVTGAAADHRLPLRAGAMDGYVRALARRLGVQVDGAAEVADTAWLDALVHDLQAHPGRSLVLAGDHLPASAHAVVHAINDALGNVGKTVMPVEPVEARPEQHTASLKQLADDMEQGKVETLIILERNPVYDAPADLDFEARMQRVTRRVHLGLYYDETARQCHWHIPAAHYLEAWGDTRAYDGTASVVQPLIEPLYRGKSALEVMASLNGSPGVSGYDLVRAYWEANGLAKDDEKAWRAALHDGIVPRTNAPRKQVALKGGLPDPAEADPGVEVVFRADPSVYDGQFANLSWVQELPRPITRITWDNAALMSPATARKLNVRVRTEKAERIKIRKGGRSLMIPAWIVPGHADDCITVHLGYGRTHGGRVASDPAKGPVGANAYTLRTSKRPWIMENVEVTATGRTYPMATTQNHPTIDENPMVKKRHHFRTGTLQEFRHHPDHPAFVHAGSHGDVDHLTIFKDFDYAEGLKWGMVIDLSRCVGCNACTIACQAENNIPVVGKEEVLNGRELHWIRVDRYFEGTAESPAYHHQPIPCMHCERAPCETVCPVGATVHSAEGLNQMVYNRCVGTRYCSNNCPYKVRRFNFYKYADHTTPTLKMQRNPNVTVRSRGVMEKCSYCVQRINAARITAKTDGNRPLVDGEVVAACQQACPTRAITFGDLNDESSAVAQAAASALNYGVLSELNTRPRTTYLARVTHPHPALRHETPGHEEPHA
jgi:molybdopterin-containing oxidoreductase family iron-sulfur binding subunit